MIKNKKQEQYTMLLNSMDKKKYYVHPSVDRDDAQMKWW